MSGWTTEVFAKNLRYYLNKSGKTQKEVARIIGVSAPTFHEWCSGKKTPRMDKVERLATYFGILKSDLIEDKQKQPAESELSIRKKAFMQKVAEMSDDQIERLEQILALVESKGQ